MDMQQQLREDLRYQEAEVQRLRDIEGYFQESNEKVKEAPGEGEGGQAGLLCEDSAEEERDGRRSMEELLVREVKRCLVEKCSQSAMVLSASFDFESGNQPIKMNPFTFTMPPMEAQRSLCRAC